MSAFDPSATLRSPQKFASPLATREPANDIDTAQADSPKSA